MLKIRQTASVLAISTMLVLGACGKKDKGSNAEIPGVGQLSVKGADAKTMQKLLAVDDRKVESGEAEKALGLLGLGDSQSDSLSWGNKDGSSGDYHYTDLAYKSDDNKDLKIADLKLDGVHMAGESATFDRMVVKGMAIADKDGSGTVDSLILSRPHPKVAARILNGLGKIDSLDDLDMDVDLKDGERAFGAIYVEGVDMTSDDGKLSMDSFGMGSNADGEKGAFLAKNMVFEGVDDKNGTPVKFSLKSASATEVDTGMFDKLGEGMKTMSPMQSGSGLGNFEMEGLSLSADTLSIDAAGMAIKSSGKGSVRTHKSVMQPLKVSFNGQPQAPEMMQAYEALKTMGFETLEFSGQSTTTYDKDKSTMSVKDANFALKDGFNLQYAFDGSGVAEGGDMSNFSLSKLNLKLTDHSIVDKAINMAAQMQGSNPAMLRMQAKGGLMFLPAMAETTEEKELMGQVAEAAGKFLDDGGTLVLDLNPSAPLTAAEMQALSQRPDQAIKRLGIKVAHQK